MVPPGFAAASPQPQRVLRPWFANGNRSPGHTWRSVCAVPSGDSGVDFVCRCCCLAPPGNSLSAVQQTTRLRQRRMYSTGGIIAWAARCVKQGKKWKRGKRGKRRKRGKEVYKYTSIQVDEGTGGKVEGKGPECASSSTRFHSCTAPVFPFSPFLPLLVSLVSLVSFFPYLSTCSPPRLIKLDLPAPHGDTFGQPDADHQRQQRGAAVADER